MTGGTAARDLTAALRRAGLRADRAFDGRSMKAQLKAADRSGARVALIVGPDELAAGYGVRSARCGAPATSAPCPGAEVVEAVRPPAAAPPARRPVSVTRSP